jgi:hypothetical protein
MPFIHRQFIYLAAVFFAGSLHAEPVIEQLQESDIQDGCGCYFHVPFSQSWKGKTMLQWEADSPASMRVDGKLHKLSVKLRPSPTKGQEIEKVGDTTFYDLKNKDIKVTTKCTAIEVCSYNDESCESTQYSALISVVTPHGSKSFQAWGSCGC